MKLGNSLKKKVFVPTVHSKGPNQGENGPRRSHHHHLRKCSKHAKAAGDVEGVTMLLFWPKCIDPG